VTTVPGANVSGAVGAADSGRIRDDDSAPGPALVTVNVEEPKVAVTESDWLIVTTHVGTGAAAAPAAK
jgi:hypothetical protein